MLIEQALYGSRDAAGYRFLARSPGFRDEWLPEAEGLCTDFGEPPAGVASTGAVFAMPFGSRQVAIVRVSGQSDDDAGRPGALEFHLLVLPQTLYADLGGDPFHIADRCPLPHEIEGKLASIAWTDGRPPSRTVESLRKVLDVPNSAILLGGAQTLLDGGRLVFERREPAGELVRSLWALLPTNSRCRLWPATLVFANASRFDVAVLPRADDPALGAYVDEERAGDYPEGRYELALQIAIEHGDQERLDALLARRSRRQVFQLGIALLLVLTVGPVAVSLLVPRATRPTTTAKPDTPSLRLPPASECPSLDVVEREKLASRLATLGRRFDLDISPATTDEALCRGLAALDARLGTPEPGRNPGRLSDLGPLQRQLRALLWKHSVAGYDVPGVNTVELLEKLDAKLAAPTAKSESR